jgi:putative peptide zinc metalloprotease protein
LDEHNLGSFLREGTVVCLVGQPECQTAVVMVSQDDVNLVRVGQRVRFAWNELKEEIPQGEIVELSGLDLDKLPRWASSRLNLPVRYTANRGLRPIGTWYQARVRLTEGNSSLLRNSTGQARILVEPQSLFSRMARWIKQTFPV